ncbi:hypothetical protein [Trinickia sp.]|uniref:hypothetical protein n=1 Tax=Trinickia sp. TaxID=2571163 RepID=UPI003F821B40
MNQTLNLTIGQQGAEVVKHSPVPIKRSGMNGLRMYDAGKPFKDLGATVVLKEDYSAIAFPPVEHLAFYEEGSMGGGIDEIALDLLLPRLPKSRTDTRAWAEYEDTAFKLVQNTIDRINAAGWQRWISFSDPRLSGRDTIDFVPGYRNRAYTAEWQDMWGIDPSYRMTREDWDNLSERWPHWYWIKHGATIELRYEKDDRGPEKPPLFDTLRVTIRSADTTSGWLYGPTKGDWKTYKQSEMARKLAARKESEAAARAAGAKILEAYKDYPIGGVRLPEIEQ